MKNLRMKLALWLMPEFERFLHNEAMQVHRNICMNFGGRAIRELLRPETITEIEIRRESADSRVIH